MNKRDPAYYKIDIWVDNFTKDLFYTMPNRIRIPVHDEHKEHYDQSRDVKFYLNIIGSRSKFTIIRNGVLN